MVDVALIARLGFVGALKGADASARLNGWSATEPCVRRRSAAAAGLFTNRVRAHTSARVCARARACVCVVARRAASWRD